MAFLRCKIIYFWNFECRNCSSELGKVYCGYVDSSYDITHVSARDILTKVSMYQVTRSPDLLKTPENLMQSLKLGIDIELATSC